MIVEEVRTWYECAKCKASILSTSYMHKSLEDHIKNLSMVCSHCYPLRKTQRITRMSIKRAAPMSRVHYWGSCNRCGASVQNIVFISDKDLNAALTADDLNGHARCDRCGVSAITVLRVHKN
jgi:DNA-directed RNA polymerase subunit RPC12/RpoP